MGYITYQLRQAVYLKITMSYLGLCMVGKLFPPIGSLTCVDHIGSRRVSPENVATYARGRCPTPMCDKFQRTRQFEER